MMSEGLFEVSSTQQHRLDEAVCAATFDTAHELLWTGSSGGAVQGYACPSLDRYAEWKAHVQPVLTRGLLVTANGPLSASADALQLHARGGLPIMTYREPAADLRCVEWERIGGSRVLLGHTSGKVAVFDLPTARVLSEESGGQGVEVLRSNGRVVACGGVGGELSLRDVRTMRVESTVEAHLGPVQALDVKGDLLVSCGLTQRSGRIFCDPLIKVFDIRQAVRALTHIPFPPGPSVVRFQPKFSSVLLIASASGAIMLTDVQIGGIAVQSYQVDCDGAALLACDVSSSGELLAFGDSAGFVHLWSSREDAPVSMFSHPLELPSPSPPPPLLPLHEHDSFSQAYRPEATDVALSVLDTNTMLRVGLPPRTIDGSLQEAMSVVDFVGYVQNPQWRRGMSYAAALEATAALRNRRQVCEGDDIKGGAQNGANPSLVGSRGSHNAPKPVLPKGYRRVEIKQSQSAKFEEFDFSYYNRTRFAGLENDFSDSHINALLQVLYFTPELKDMVTGHVCEREFCLTCELGFVLHMLALAERSTCQPTNLIRALRQMPEAAALGLMDDWEGNEGKPLGERIQRLSCFFLEQLHKEVSAEEGPQQSVVDALFGTAVATRTKCLRAFHESPVQERHVLQLDLQYPPPRAGSRLRFADILQRSLHRQEDVRAWCQACRSYQLLSQVRTPTSLPQTLLVHCGVRNDEDLSFWHTEPGKEDRVPDSVITRTSSGALGSEQWLPFHIDIELNSSGVKVTEEFSSMGVTISKDLEKGAIRGSYELTAMIAYVHDDGDEVELDYEGHLVAHVKIPVGYAESHSAPPHFSPPANSGTPSPGIPPLTPSGHRIQRRPSFSQVSPLHVSSFPVTAQSETTTGGSSPQQVSQGSPSGALPVVSPMAAGVEKVVGSGEWTSEGRMMRTTSSPAAPLGLSEGEGQVAEGNGPRVGLSRSDSRGSHGAGDWVLFNDFCITPTGAQEVVTFYGKRKIPCFLQYTRVHLLRGDDSTRNLQLEISLPATSRSSLHSQPSPIPDELFKRLVTEPTRAEAARSFWPLELPREPPRPGMLLGIDSEFVALSAPEMSFRDDGSEYVQRPSRLGLARVSVVRGEGPNAGICCIDDYIRTVEPVYDYLTRYSGLQHGDLDEGVSKHHLTSMKKAYLKLRYLVDMGCRFVGHGLKKDFRIVNIVVPQEQVIDTVELFHLKRQRKLSLRFLASYLLKIDIQKETHDSIEDARTALRLYDKYQQLVASGEFQEKLLEIYHYGRRHGWEMVSGGAKELDHSKSAPVLKL